MLVNVVDLLHAKLLGLRLLIGSQHLRIDLVLYGFTVHNHHRVQLSLLAGQRLDFRSIVRAIRGGIRILGAP